MTACLPSEPGFSTRAVRPGLRGAGSQVQPGWRANRYMLRSNA